MAVALLSKTDGTDSIGQYGAVGSPTPPRTASIATSSASAAGAARLRSIAALWRQGYTVRAQLETRAEGDPVRGYYEAQNALLERFVDIARSNPELTPEDKEFLDAEHGLSMAEDEDAFTREFRGHGDAVTAEQGHSKRAIYLSNAANIALLFAQFYALVVSGSCAMLAVFLDAALDVTSGLVILATWNVKKQRADRNRYPVGRSRLEPLGIILMACLMTAGTLTSIKASLERTFEVLVSGERASGFVGLTFRVAVILGLALLTKGSLYLYCRHSRNPSVMALSTDHGNDVLASSFAVFAMVVTQHVHGAALLDPVGGILISFLIIRNWGELVLEHVENLLGTASSVEIISQIVFIGLNHSSHIMCLDTVRAYQLGNGAYAEVDIVLDSDMPLQQAHDIAEGLQQRVEEVPGVERCFTHCDTETDHSPTTEHREIW